MPSLLDLPRELRDIILDLVVSTPAVARPDLRNRYFTTAPDRTELDDLHIRVVDRQHQRQIRPAVPVHKQPPPTAGQPPTARLDAGRAAPSANEALIRTGRRHRRRGSALPDVDLRAGAVDPRRPRIHHDPDARDQQDQY